MRGLGHPRSLPGFDPVGHGTATNAGPGTGMALVLAWYGTNPTGGGRPIASPHLLGSADVRVVALRLDRLQSLSAKQPFAASETVVDSPGSQEAQS